MKLLIVINLVLLIAFGMSVPAQAHPGRTDADGGHTCRKNCENWGLSTGEYHSHNSSSVPASVEQKAPQIAPTLASIKHTTKTTSKTVPIVVPLIQAETKYTETEYDKKKMFKVVKVMDGDTIEVNVRGVTERVRLLAIDSPETSDPRKSVQCFSKEATNKLSSLLKGKYVKLVDDTSQGNKDKYRRLLRYVYDGDLFINAEMVKTGFAFSYKKYPTKYLNEFNTYEYEARDKGFGLWSACNYEL